LSWARSPAQQLVGGEHCQQIGMDQAPSQELFLGKGPADDLVAHEYDRPIGSSPAAIPSSAAAMAASIISSGLTRGLRDNLRFAS
jgi:hypothetical protein